jgi:hypothetical protein
MVIKYICQDFPLQDPPKFAKNGIFGLKTNHMANLSRTIVFFPVTDLQLQAIIQLGVSLTKF